MALIKKKYNKREYLQRGEITFTRQEFEHLYDENGWKPKYFEDIKASIYQAFGIKMNAGKKHDGARLLSVYLKCASCYAPAILKAKTCNATNGQKKFCFSTSCNCMIEKGKKNC